MFWWCPLRIQKLQISSELQVEDSVKKWSCMRSLILARLGGRRVESLGPTSHTCVNEAWPEHSLEQ